MANALVSLGIAIGSTLLLTSYGGGRAASSDVTNVISAPPIPPEALHGLTQSERQAKAFAAVFGKPEPVVMQVDGSEEITTPAQLIWQGDRAVLITKTEITAGCHYCSGSLGVYYLKIVNDTFEVTGKFDHAIDGGVFGQPPEWSVSDKFGPVATVYSENIWGGQGYACAWFGLTELASDGPHRLVRVGRDTNGLGGFSPNGTIEAKIDKIEPGKSFTVIFIGSKRVSETYLRTPNGYILVGRSKMPTCQAQPRNMESDD